MDQQTNTPERTPEKTPRQIAEEKRAERLKYMRIQRNIRMGAIALAILLSIVSLCVSCSTKKAVADLAEKIAAKKANQAALAAEVSASPSAAPAVAPSEKPEDSVSLTLSFVGDVTLASYEGAPYAGSFEEYYDNYGDGYFFQNVRSIFEGDDLTVANLEGTFTTSTVFALPTKETFVGLENYTYGIFKMNFLSSLGYSLLITVSSVVLILLCCSMTGWYLTRVNNKLSKFMNLLIVFSMVVPFQMVMFTLSKTADTLNLNTPWNICIIYLGFGAGLAVFMFTGFMKSVPIEIEEAAMIDGCNPLQIFFKVVFPILKPTMISTAILETMWVWNDYLLPTLVLDIKKYRTIPMAIQYFRGGYGRVELAPMMACIIIAIIPIILLYITCQKYIIEGVVAGAVKG